MKGKWAACNAQANGAASRENVRGWAFQNDVGV